MEKTAAAHESTLDAREVDGDPFEEIMAALEDLSADGSLLLLNSFEPKPLYEVLEQRGFTHESEQVSADEWRVAISPA